MTKKIHFHTDCAYFAGCENMLANLLNSKEFSTNFERSFSYRHTREYETRLKKRIEINFPIHALRIPNPDWMEKHGKLWGGNLGRALKGILGLLTFLPITVYDFLILIKLFRNSKADMVHINNGGYPGALSCRIAAVSARVCGITKIVMVVNNIAEPYVRMSRWLDYPLDRLVRNSVSLFVTGSRHAGESLKAVLNLENDQVRCLHNGIASRELTEKADKTRQRLDLNQFDGLLVGVVALMEKRKGHRILLEAVDQIISSREFKKDKKFLVLLEGDGPERPDLENRVKSHNLKDYVKFISTEDNIWNFLNMLDLVVLPSIEREDFPNVVLEAMSLGKPVIASRLAGTPEQIVDGKTGLLVAPGDAGGLANALRKLLNDKQFCQELGENGRDRFESNFTADIAVSRYLELYGELTGGNC